MENVQKVLDQIGAFADSSDTVRGAIIVGGVGLTMLAGLLRLLRKKPPERSVIHVSVPAGQSARVEVEEKA